MRVYYRINAASIYYTSVGSVLERFLRPDRFTGSAWLLPDCLVNLITWHSKSKRHPVCPYFYSVKGQLYFGFYSPGNEINEVVFTFALSLSVVRLPATFYMPWSKGRFMRIAPFLWQTSPSSFRLRDCTRQMQREIQIRSLDLALYVLQERDLCRVEETRRNRSRHLFTLSCANNCGWQVLKLFELPRGTMTRSLATYRRSLCRSDDVNHVVNHQLMFPLIFKSPLQY